MKKITGPLSFYVVVVAASILLLAPCAPAQEKKYVPAVSVRGTSISTVRIIEYKFKL
jgi:hypothetical protein